MPQRFIHVIAVIALSMFLAPMAVSAQRFQGMEALKDVPEVYRWQVASSLRVAGDHRGELIRALKEVPEAHRRAMAFLIANMPERDARVLSADFLLDTVEYAYKAREGTPWGKAIPEEVFFNYVLPYANINEERDPWRKEFYEAFLPIALQADDMGQVVERLNHEAFDLYGVKYHPTKRPKPDQSPRETIEAGYASCTGLSVMLIDACRAVGIPARFAGKPSWTTARGNHSWVEAWDGQWNFIGACEGGDLDKTWFFERARKADPDKLMHRIYASSFQDTGTWFPLVWNLKLRYVNAIDVTPFYTHRRAVKIEVAPSVVGNGGPAWVTVHNHGWIVAY